MGLRLKLYSYKEFNNKNEMKKQKRKKKLVDTYRNTF